MNQTEYQIAKREKLKNKAFKLYKQGFTTRQIGKIVGKSHAWVAILINEKLSTEKILDKV